MKYTLPQNLTRSFQTLYHEIRNPHVMVCFDKTTPRKFVITFSLNEFMENRRRYRERFLSRLCRDMHQDGCHFQIFFGPQVHIELEDEKDAFILISKAKLITKKKVFQ